MTAPEAATSPAALLFAGQGNHQVGMGARLVEASAAAREAFELAEAVAGAPIGRIAREGPEGELDRPEVAHLALLALEVAEARYLLARGLEPHALCGYGLGHLAALAAADALTLEAALTLALARVRLAREALGTQETQVASVIGLERPLVREICQSTVGLGPVEVAGHHAPGQSLIAGTRAAVRAAADRCEEEFGTVIPLRVAVPFHTSLLESAVEPFAALVEATPVSAPARMVVDAGGARPLGDAAHVRRSIVALMTEPVMFEESLAALNAMGIARFVQCGPGTALLGLAKRVAKGADLETFEAAAGLQR